MGCFLFVLCVQYNSNNNNDNKCGKLPSQVVVAACLWRPGTSTWLDFVSPHVREFWASKFLPSDYKGSTCDVYTWNDMNEPSVFNGPEITMHKDCIHHGGWEHRDVHNVYGMYVVSSRSAVSLPTLRYCCVPLLHCQISSTCVSAEEMYGI